MQSINRPPLRYPGGKFVASKVILKFFPKHTCFVDVFGGGANISILKSPSPIEIYNDKDSEIVNFFRVLREHEDELIRLIRLTPYSRNEMILSYEVSEDPIESARRLYVRLWQSRGISLDVSKKSGWRVVCKGHNLAGNWDDCDRLHLVAKRLKDFCIECAEYTEMLDRYDSPDTLFFLDPPYVLETRNLRSLYKFEMDDAEHLQMLEKLMTLEAKIILCGYESPLYQRLLDSNWTQITYKSGSNGGGNRVESLYLSPNCNQQRTLFNWSE